MSIPNNDIMAQLLQKPPLVQEKEIKALGCLLSTVYQSPNDYFILQIGDCAERFEDSSKEIVFKKCQFYTKMAQLLENRLQKKVILLGRIAGQYAKPRTDEHERRNGITFPIYKGDMINAFEFTAEARKTNLDRIIKAYNCASLVLGHMQAFQENSNYKIFTSHEALVLEYENGLTRKSSEAKNYNSSAHTVWLGHRSKELNGPQIEYLSTIENPIGIKLGPTQSPEKLVSLLKQLNPEKREGKVYLVTRLGVNSVQKILPQFIHTVQKSDIPVLWCVDPMHGNTFKLDDGRKVRSLKDILSEYEFTQKIHLQSNSHLVGLHLEASCDSVTECVMGEKKFAHLNEFSRYTTQCDPRLNPDQVIFFLNHINNSTVHDLLTMQKNSNLNIEGGIISV